MKFQVLLAAVLVAGLCVLEVMADKGSSKNKFDINSDLHSIDISDEVAVRQKFDQFKSKFGREYDTKEEEEFRYNIFKSNLAQIKEMNANKERPSYLRI